LGDQALVYAKPQLEIYADDVKCSHGATVGQVDGQELFYLRARGISEPEARKLLLLAFAGEIIDKVSFEQLRASLFDSLSVRLSQLS
jgi:Fe-S cluster assembly protein SufD